jgi:hypothetical protein
LKGFEFDPWDRGPTAAERDSLLADGLTPERFQDRSVPSDEGSPTGRFGS